MTKPSNDPLTAAKSSEPETFLRRPQVLRLTGIKTSTLYALIKKGKFPRPIAISKRLVVWSQSEIIDWQKTQVARRA